MIVSRHAGVLAFACLVITLMMLNVFVAVESQTMLHAAETGGDARSSEVVFRCDYGVHFSPML
jgi:hypothetical protein